MSALAIRRSAAAKLLAAGVAAIAGACVLYAFPPETSAFYPRCAFHYFTGLQCPGCGTTRALHHLLHLRIADAFRMNPMLFALMGVALFALPSFARGETPRFMTTRWFGWSSVVAIVGWWIARNV